MYVSGSHHIQCILQGETANPLQKRLAGKVENYQVVGDIAGPGRLENIVMLLPGVTVRACAACQPASATRTAVVIDDVRIELGPFKCEPWPTSLSSKMLFVKSNSKRLHA